MLIFTVKKEDNDQTLISLLKKKFKSTSLSLIYKLFRTKKIKVNDKNIRYYHYRLREKEVVKIYDDSLRIFQPKFIPPIKTKIDLKIVYEDENILLVMKESNVEVHGGKNNNCLNSVVRYYFYQQDPEYYQKQFKTSFIFNAVHRIDKLASGLIIYPKNSASKKILSEAINDKKKITKKYLVICEDLLKKRLPNYISGYLWKDKQAERMIFSLEKNQFNAKHCALEIKKINHKNNCKLFEVTLHTGRKHQIRAILSYFGYPIIGDKKYGSKIILKNQIYLLAYKIMFNNLPNFLSYLNDKEFCLKNSINKFIRFLEKIK